VEKYNFYFKNNELIKSKGCGIVLMKGLEKLGMVVDNLLVGSCHQDLKRVHGFLSTGF
jgi:hypothetical protein